ncbi:PAAR domain-containing protein [Nostoc sp. FACHB-152]|uniref:PAAR domain-containing protein n=1 Tax=unclassified Nostoc TaxID=2593658 RepID=UPI0016853DEC|nr:MULTISPECIES: PAAR domain-containing protein [unclassified Nostoc]MBD2449273.1 PAAR domain-containing protein [Nostoc sp. FACHB-152]MBD2470449.1 PAAR domain-containing protein [Nostoc sp. FACHB-145]
MSKPAARITDNVAHPLPPVLTGGPGSPNVLIGNLPAWRGIPAAALPALQSAKQASDIAVQTAEAASKAATGTPGAPAAIAAEQTTKATAAATMSSMISAAAASSPPSMADIHQCATPLPIPPHGPGVVIDGSKTVLINGLPACRLGDTILEALGPTNKIVKGEPTVLIGG